GDEGAESGEWSADGACEGIHDDARGRHEGDSGELPEDVEGGAPDPQDGEAGGGRHEQRERERQPVSGEPREGVDLVRGTGESGAFVVARVPGEVRARGRAAPAW